MKFIESTICQYKQTQKRNIDRHSNENDEAVQIFEQQQRMVLESNGFQVMKLTHDVLDMALVSYDDIKAVIDGNNIRSDVASANLDLCFDHLKETMSQNAWFVGLKTKFYRDYRGNYLIHCDVMRLQLAIISITRSFFVGQTAMLDVLFNLEMEDLTISLLSLGDRFDAQLIDQHNAFFNDFD